jgi:ribosomal protein S18 acetylase RimI-like enzyme
LAGRLKIGRQEGETWKQDEVAVYLVGSYRNGGSGMLDAETVVMRATNSDLELARQAVDVYLATSQHPTSLDDTALREFLADPRTYLILATREGKVLGTLYGYALSHPHRPEPQFFLYGIDVRPEHRNQGIGTALVCQFVIEAKREKAFEVWVLTDVANRSAIAMYAHAGFQRRGLGEVMLELAL